MTEYHSHAEWQFELETLGDTAILTSTKYGQLMGKTIGPVESLRETWAELTGENEDDE